MQTPFEPTNTFCYQFARYQVLPEIIALPEVQTGNGFRLVEMVKKVVDIHLTPDQQYASYPRAQTGELLTVLKTIKWYVPFIAKKTGQLIAIGAGEYRLPDVNDIAEEETEAQGIEDSIEGGTEADAVELEGFIYAFTFPMLIRPAGAYPIKIGMTVNNVQERVAAQCKGSAIFEVPKVLGSWRVARVSSVESAIHKMLAARGKWRKSVPGTEWFDTTPEEIQSIIDFTGCTHP
jgi:hypothetical protein